MITLDTTIPHAWLFRWPGDKAWSKSFESPVAGGFADFEHVPLFAPADPMRDTQPVASRSSVSTDEVGATKLAGAIYGRLYCSDPMKWPAIIVEETTAFLACLQPSLATLADETLRAEVERLTAENARFKRAHERHLVMGAETLKRAEAAEAKLAAQADIRTAANQAWHYFQSPDSYSKEEKSYVFNCLDAALSQPAPEGQNAEASLREALKLCVDALADRASCVEAGRHMIHDGGDMLPAEYRLMFEARNAALRALSPETAT